MSRRDSLHDFVRRTLEKEGLVSSIVNGKRSISKAQAKKLGEIFNISASVFI
jgi:HTH-type transcriptional regulator / antitoxin HigA